MPKSANERGIKSPFKLRVGIDVDSFRGLNLENDPGAIADSEFQDLINARIRSGGEIVSRGGQDKMFADALGSAVVGIFDDEIAELPAMLYIGASDVRTWTTAQTPNIQAVGTAGKTEHMVGVFLNSVWFWVTNGADVDFYSIVATPGGGAPAPIFRFKAVGHGVGNTISTRGEGLVVGGKLYMMSGGVGGLGGINNQGVFSYDGAAFTQEIDTTAELHVHASFGQNYKVRPRNINQDVYATINYENVADNTLTDISVRKRSSGPGTWSAITRWTSNDVASGHSKDVPWFMTPFQSKLYFGCTTSQFAGPQEELRIRAVDPAAVVGTSADFVLKRTVLSAVPGNICEMANMVVFDSHLYYLYADFGTNKFWLGRFDGTTWTDQYADMTATFAPAGFYPRGAWFITTTSTLYMLCSGTLFQSNGTDATSWTSLGTGLPQAFENFEPVGVRL